MKRTDHAQLEGMLHADIPLARAMGVRVAGYDGQALKLAAPLAPNINHKETAFGGSLYALAVLCGWGLLHLKLAEAGLSRHIVIQEGNIRYLRPVRGELLAECRADESALAKMLRALHRHGRARIALEAAIVEDGAHAVAFAGRYVVHG